MNGEEGSKGSRQRREGRGWEKEEGRGRKRRDGEEGEGGRGREEENRDRNGWQEGGEGCVPWLPSLLVLLIAF